MTSRETYLSLATAGFAQKGFNGLSLAALAQEAGVSKQALLHHFKTKEALYAEVLEGLAARLLTRLNGSQGGDAQTRLLRYFTDHINHSLADITDAQLVTRALLESPSSARLWPLTPYLEALIDLAATLPAWRGVERSEILAGLYLLIGALHYVAISATTLAGMYDDIFCQDMQTAAKKQLITATEAFIHRR